jgi:hypothetical protein
MRPPACSGVITPPTTIITAPSKAAAGRFSGKTFSCRPLMSKYVTQKIPTASSSLWLLFKDYVIRTDIPFSARNRFTSPTVNSPK